MSAPSTLRQVGVAVIRKDGLAKVTGAARARGRALVHRHGGLAHDAGAPWGPSPGVVRWCTVRVSWRTTHVGSARLVAPFIGIKLIDLAIGGLGLA